MLNINKRMATGQLPEPCYFPAESNKLYFKVNVFRYCREISGNPFSKVL